MQRERADCPRCCSGARHRGRGHRACHLQRTTIARTPAGRQRNSHAGARPSSSNLHRPNRLSDSAPSFFPERSTKRAPTLANAARAFVWPDWIGVALPAAAFALGALLEHIADRQHVNVLAFPLLAIVLWNIAVYALLAVDWVLRVTRYASRLQHGRSAALAHHDPTPRGRKRRRACDGGKQYVRYPVEQAGSTADGSPRGTRVALGRGDVCDRRHCRAVCARPHLRISRRLGKHLPRRSFSARDPVVLSDTGRPSARHAIPHRRADCRDAVFERAARPCQ